MWFTKIVAVLAPVSKAIAGGIAAGVSAYVTAASHPPITEASWIFIAGSVVVGAVVVYWAPRNKVVSADTPGVVPGPGA